MGGLARAAVAVMLAVGLSSCGGGGSSSARDRVGAYIKSVNAIENRVEPALQHANLVYRQFSHGRVAGTAAIAGLAGAQDTIDGIRARVARLHPPREALRLHRLVLRFLALNSDMAQESTELALYLPRAQRVVAAVGPINARLSRGLAKSPTPARQSRALRQYATQLRRVIAGLRRLRPPPILAATNASQIDRLQSAVSLAGSLRKAAAARNSPLVARLLLRFRKVNSTGKAGRLLSDEEIRAYDVRYALIGDATAAVRREEVRLQRTLG